jgi:hypothetical protein
MTAFLELDVPTYLIWQKKSNTRIIYGSSGENLAFLKK